MSAERPRLDYGRALEIVVALALGLGNAYLGFQAVWLPVRAVLLLSAAICLAVAGRAIAGR